MTIPANDETKQAFKVYLLKELASVDFNQILGKIKALIESGDIDTARSTFSEAARSLLSFGAALDFGYENVFRQPDNFKYAGKGSGSKMCAKDCEPDEEGPEVGQRLMPTFPKFKKNSF